MGLFDVKQFVNLGKKIVGAGLNYNSLAKSRSLAVPKEPMIFLKPTTSYIQQGHSIQYPEGFEVSHEVELGVIVGRRCKDVPPEEVYQYIGGYCVALDLTAHNILNEARLCGSPWTLGKGFDTATPVGEGIPCEEGTTPPPFHLYCSVNGELRQDENTSDMVFPVPHLISYISRYMTLEPYDLILTGSPSGVGSIRHGDIICAGIRDLTQIQFNVK